jgi:uncharacterized protein
MIIYFSDTSDFASRIRDNSLTRRMSEAFRELLGRSPGSSEVMSWQNSLSRVRDLIDLAELQDNFVALEYRLPYNENRIDCLLFGQDSDSAANVFLIELKQWSQVEPHDDEGNFVETYTGGATRIVPHPSQQVKGYDHYMRNFIAAFDGTSPLKLHSCVYCHNYDKREGTGIFAQRYIGVLDAFPVYTAGDTVALAARIKRLLSAGKGLEVFNRFMQSPVRPSEKLLENVGRLVKDRQDVFALLNEQIVAKNTIWAKVRKPKAKSVVIVHGGPGTGKSVIAVNILAEAAAARKRVFYACKSKPFTEGLKSLVGKDAGLLFSNLQRFVPSKVAEGEVDLLLVDEAHRIEKTSNFQYTRAEDRTDLPQVEQLIRCAKTSVFFVDDLQNVRSKEIGSSALIKETAIRLGRPVSEIQLQTQFRCMGSNDYLRWVESALGFTAEKRVLSESEIFDFQVMESPEALYDRICAKEAEKENSARLVAGYCWPWSKTLGPDGDLVKDVRIGDFAMPWETHEAVPNPPKGYVKWYEWAYKTQGIKQIGCIYTAQGFEFEYIGVIIGPDLSFDEEKKEIVTRIEETRDPTLKRSPDHFSTHVRNIYRVLLTRGMKGCYVYFVDKGTEKFFRSRMEECQKEVDYSSEGSSVFAEYPIAAQKPLEL